MHPFIAAEGSSSLTPNLNGSVDWSPSRFAANLPRHPNYKSLDSARHVRMIAARNMDTSIAEIRAREILDSRGNPTVEVDVGSRAARSAARRCRAARAPVNTKHGNCATAMKRYGGKGVTQGGRERERQHRPEICKGSDALEQATIDKR